MTGGLYDAATLERWNVVNRVVADDELQEKGMRVRPAARRRADRGPRGDEADRPRLLRGRHRARRRGHARASSRELFATEDLQNAVKSFLADGPGKATFEGR